MRRLLASAVAAAYVFLGTPLLFIVLFAIEMDGPDQHSWAVLILLAIYVYGVAAFAVRYAVKPFAKGIPILAGLCAPVVLTVGWMIAYSMWASLRATFF